MLLCLELCLPRHHRVYTDLRVLFGAMNGALGEQKIMSDRLKLKVFFYYYFTFCSKLHQCLFNEIENEVCN